MRKGPMKINRPRPNKELGQHYLTSKNVIDSIVMNPPKEAFIIEVGPGPGALTEKLHALFGEAYHALEMDERFRESLHYLKDNQLTFADATKIDFDLFIQKLGSPSPLWVVSNLPYNASVPLFLAFTRCASIDGMTLMFQKEVAEKILPPSGKKNPTGSLMMLGQNYFEITQLCKVPPGCFSPPPKVDSLVLTFRRRPNPLISLTEFLTYEDFLRKIFQGKRKQLGTVLKMSYPQLQRESFWAQAAVPSTIRSESMSVSEVNSLYQLLKKEIR